MHTHADIRPMMNSNDGAGGTGSACSDNAASLSIERANSSIVGSPANCVERMWSAIRGSTTAFVYVGAGGTSARSNTLPVLSARALGRGSPFPASAPMPNSAHAPINTIVAPFRLTRESRLCEFAVRHSSPSSTRSADLTSGRPRGTASGSSRGVDIRRAAGTRLGCRLRPVPAVPGPGYESNPHATCFLRAERPPSEWKLSARRANALSDSSSSSYALDWGSVEWGRLLCLRVCSSCCAAKAATAATFAATFERVR